jgi:glucan biosynthesis protein C
MKERRYDIDWLRVITMFIVFVFHCSRFFCTEGWHLKVPPEEQSEVLPIVRDMLVGVWQMELFFLVAGFATWYSLARRTAGQYLLERVKRLLVPLYGVGLFVLLVPQAYFEGITKGYITESFWRLFPTYYPNALREMLSWWAPWIDPATLLPYPFSGHLWFLRTLFVIVLATLAVLLFLRSERGRRFIDRLAEKVARPGGTYLFLIPLAIVQVSLRWIPNLPERNWSDFLWYALFFVYGYILAADPRFTESIKRRTWVWLAQWLGVFVVGGGLLQFVFHYDTDPGQGFSLLFVIFAIAWCFISWSAVAFMLSLGARYLTTGSKLLTYANEAVLPFYLFHQTIILIVGWFVLPLNISNWARFAIITLVSFPVILVLYEALVRRIGFMRFLFGMAPQKK